MFQLLLIMLERLGIIVTVAFVLTRLRFFRYLINEQKINRGNQFSAMLFFGFFGIIGTYTGLIFDASSLHMNQWVYTHINPNEAIANSRVIGIVIAGLLGGYKIGLGAGLIAGAHRYMLGGFTAIACSISALFAGLISGAIRQTWIKQKNHPLRHSTAFLTGALSESVQMLIILLVSKPFDQALTLVEGIGLPMIIANGIGSALFLAIIQNVVNEEEKAGALQAQKALRLAELTLSHMRKGLSVESAQNVCKILCREVEASAISMTNKEKILAHIGLGDDHHKANVPIQTSITKQVLDEGKIMVVSHNYIHCKNNDCPLKRVVVAPLKYREETVGTLKFYFQSEKEIMGINLQLIKGLSSLLSQQLELAEAEKAYHLATELEIKALQAQINPHFLFNSLNTIVSLIRIEPNKARKLLISLSHFFRQNLAGTTKTTTNLREELRHVQAYLEIEETRFVDRFKVSYSIDDETLTVQIPPLTLQPIVENAIKHGIKEKMADCHLQINIIKRDHWVDISVLDNGVGIPKNKLNVIGTEMCKGSQESTGLGLYNVNRRLVMMYGEESALNFSSVPNQETKVSFKLPVRKGMSD